MKKKAFLIVNILCLVAFLGLANAQDYTIGDYDFNWRVAKVGDVRLAVQKNPKGVHVVLQGLGGGLTRLTMTPFQAKTVGDALKKTGSYYDGQMKQKDPNMDQMVTAGDHKIYYTSSRGRNFQVAVRKTDVGAAVVMDKDQALEMAKYLGGAEKLAAPVNERIRP